ncbi:flagellar FlbD family protein [Oscillospiraceae bacterium MB08-C2-2]|nr:flagellar FlbD family protein [Oscillospiraceae bacterium MB08-C2-2]
MIKLTKLNKKEFYLNCELIETVEATPDTVITLRNGKLYIVAESPDEIVESVLKYKKGIL